MSQAIVGFSEHKSAAAIPSRDAETHAHNRWALRRRALAEAGASLPSDDRGGRVRVALDGGRRRQLTRRARMRWNSWRALLVTAAAVPLFGLGCGSSHERVIKLTNSDSGRSVAVAVGAEIDMTVQTVGPGQYGTPALSSECVRFAGVSLAGSPNPGGPRQLFRFEAKAPGRAKITIAHEGGAPGGPTTPTFSITVEVR